MPAQIENTFSFSVQTCEKQLFPVCVCVCLLDPGLLISNTTASPRPCLPLAVYERAEPCV